ETDTKCGSYTVHISTSCRSVDKALGQSICYAQHFEFSIGTKKKDLFLFHSDFRSELMVATEATCIVDGSRHWLVVESTNFGSGQTCLDCERSDYFGDSAEYIGSSSSKTGSKIVVGYKKVSKNNERKIQALMRKTELVTKVDINRYPLIK
ncbi:MAG: hypothetical protein O9327_03085, partial [Polaromonas sp.]|nr:hypothetical protein [Polaromonas sp.]